MSLAVLKVANRALPSSAGSRAALVGWLQALGLDAAIVALVWQEALSRCAGVKTTISVRLALGLAVMLIYLLDRHLDALRLTPDQPTTLRHHLHLRHHKTMRLLVVACGIGLMAAAMRLPPSALAAGTMLALACGGYLLLVQRRPHMVPTGSKEAAVGLLFAFGCAVHLASSVPLPGLLLVSALFSLNCLMIAAWESHLDTLHPFPALPATCQPLLGCAALLLAAVAGTLAVHHFLSGTRPHAQLALAIAASALLLFQLNRHRRHATRHHLLADLALLTPLLTLLLP